MNRSQQALKHVRRLRRLRPLAAALALAGLGMAALSGCDEAHSKAAEAAPPAPRISVAPVIEREVAETREFSGRLEARQRIDIRPRVAGMIMSVGLTPGSLVKKGDVLFVIDNRPFKAEVERTRAAVDAARARAELARNEMERAQKLYADKAIAEREYTEKAAQFKELEAGMRAAQAGYEMARLNLEFTEVRAPIDGRVGKAEIAAGNLVDPSAVLTSLVSDDSIYASFNGDEGAYQGIQSVARRGAKVPVRIALASETGFPHEGRLEFLDNQLNAKSGGVRMRAVFENADRALLPGLFVRVKLDSGSAAAPALLVDERAIGTDQSHKYVVVVGADKKAEYRPVTLGQNVGRLRVVRSGLKVGEQVVVNGLQRVQPGSAVDVELVAMDPDAASSATAIAANGAREGKQ